MTPKQARFVAEYLIDLNGTQAAIRAGYSPKTAKVQASDLLTKPDIASAVAEGQAKQLAAADLSATRVLEELRRLAFSDLRKLFDEHGNLLSVHSLPDDMAACLASVEVVKQNIAAGDGHVDTIHKVKVWDKVRSLEGLAKHFGLLVEKQQITGTLEVKWSDG